MSLNCNGIQMLVEPGYTNTLITENLKKRLKLKGEDTSLNLITVAADKKPTSKRVKLKIGGNEMDCYAIKKLMTIESKLLELNELWPKLDKELKQDVLKNYVTAKNRHFSRPGQSRKIRS